MVKTYRTISQWDAWLQQMLGLDVLAAEKELLTSLLEKNYGKHSLLIGAPQQYALLSASVMPHHLLLSPVMGKNKSIRHIESELYALPIGSGLVDLVILPHTLELVDNPYQLLLEASRIVKPEGYIIILGFNPISLWGLTKWMRKNKHMPWSNPFLQMSKIKKWLNLIEFQLTKQETILFGLKKNKCLDEVAQKILSGMGGVYLLMAQNKSIPLTPIKTRWKQQLSGMRISMPKPTIRGGV